MNSYVVLSRIHVPWSLLLLQLISFIILPTTAFAPTHFLGKKVGVGDDMREDITNNLEKAQRLSLLPKHEMQEGYVLIGKGRRKQSGEEREWDGTVH